MIEHIGKCKKTMNNPKTFTDIVDDKWYTLSNKMIHSFDETLLLNYYQSDLNEEKEEKK